MEMVAEGLKVNNCVEELYLSVNKVKKLAFLVFSYF